MQKELDSRISEDDQAKIDRQVEQGIPLHVAELRVLGASKPQKEWEVEREEKAQDAKKRPLGWPRRPKPSRPGFGRAADTADSDKRVEDYYDNFDS